MININHTLIEKITLPNGLRIVLLPSDAHLSASVGLWIGSGSRFEKPEGGGVSHFIEHMVFKGTETRSALDIAVEMDSIGGQLNAYTTKEYTCFYARALKSHLHRAIDIICDMVTSPRLDESDIETERGVILEEIGMYEDSPEDLLIDGLFSAVWPSNMLGANILGTRETVGAMTSHDMRAHMAEQYTGRRIVAAVAGAFDRDAVLAQLSEALGGLPPGGVPFAAEEAAYIPGISIAKKKFEQIHLCLGFPAVSLNDDRRNPLSLMSAILGGTSSSRLFQRIREELGLAYSVGCSFTPYMAEGIFEVDAALGPDSAEAALREMLRELMKMKNHGVTEDELSRQKEQMKAAVIMGLEGSSATAAHLGSGELLKGRIRSEEEIISSIDEVTLEAVNASAAEFIDFEKLSISAVGKIRDGKYYRGIVSSETE